MSKSHDLAFFPNTPNNIWQLSNLNLILILMKEDFFFMKRKIFLSAALVLVLTLVMSMTACAELATLDLSHLKKVQVSENLPGKVRSS